MPRGADQHTKVHYKGTTDDFVIFVDSVQAVQDWKKDRSTPLAQVVNGWKIFHTNKHGSQGVLDTASKSNLENEFGTHNEDEVVTKILEGGNVMETENPARMGDRNVADGPNVAH